MNQHRPWGTARGNGTLSTEGWLHGNDITGNLNTFLEIILEIASHLFRGLSWFMLLFLPLSRKPHGSHPGWEPNERLFGKAECHLDFPREGVLIQTWPDHRFCSAVGGRKSPLPSLLTESLHSSYFWNKLTPWIFVGHLLSSPKGILPLKVDGQFRETRQAGKIINWYEVKGRTE